MILCGFILCGIFLAHSFSISNGQELLSSALSRFDCGNERTIPIIYKCDGEDDCGNGVDEHECTVETIINRRLRNLQLFYLLLRFDCGNGERVPNIAVCNGLNDCSNGADEENCEGRLFDCGNGKSVPNRYICDNDDDCGNGADEKNCTNSPTTSPAPCPFSSLFNFDCGNGKMVPRRYLCDSDDDCGNGADEQNCTNTQADTAQILRERSRILFLIPRSFDCGNGITVPQRFLCDGDDDCRNGADEQNCTNTPIIERFASNPSTTENPPRFDCGNGRTVPNRYLCDGDNDCWNGADERDCNNNSPTTEQTPSTTIPTENLFRFDCGNGRHTLREFLCDHDDDCGNGADERNCTNDCGRAFIALSPARTFSYPKSGEQHLETHQRCGWVFKTFPRRIIELQFREFEVGNDPREDSSNAVVELETVDCKDKVTGDCVRYNPMPFGCPDDYVEVFDGPNDSSLRLGKFCGTSIPSTVKSSNTYLFVRLHSGQTERPVRFLATYRSILAWQNFPSQLLK